MRCSYESDRKALDGCFTCSRQKRWRGNGVTYPVSYVGRSNVEPDQISLWLNNVSVLAMVPRGNQPIMTSSS